MMDKAGAEWPRCVVRTAFIMRLSSRLLCCLLSAAVAPVAVYAAGAIPAPVARGGASPSAASQAPAPSQPPGAGPAADMAAGPEDDSIGYIKLGDRTISNYCLAQLAGLAESRSSRHASLKQVALKDCQRDAYWKGYACLKDACPRDSEDGDLGDGSFETRLIGRIGGIYIVEVNSSGGGDGAFSQIVGVGFGSVARGGQTEDTLEQKLAIGEGDRANGGITDAAIKDGALVYSRAITPFDIVDIATDRKHPFKADDSIEACAECYAGSAQYHIRPGETRGVLDGIDVNYDYSFQFEDSAGVTECLMDLFADEARTHHDAETGHYEGAALAELGDRIVKACGKFEKKQRKRG